MNKQQALEQAVSVVRHEIAVDAAFFVPYEGDHASVHAAFPAGFVPSYGSGLAFKGRAPNGDLEFFGLTDRGPNGDGPQIADPERGLLESKIFPAPSFTPSIGIIRVGPTGAHLCASMPIRSPDGQAISGLPIPPQRAGSTGEVPLFDSLRFDPATPAVYRTDGMDTEALAFNSRRAMLWVSDEYGPHIARIDPATGILLARYGPGSGLPPILAKRRANRGMEGMTYDPGSDRLHAFLQSPISDGEAYHAGSGRPEKIASTARFLRWIEFDPMAGATTRMFAYPLDSGDYADGHTGNAKLGDLAPLGNGRFVVIEQGEGADGKVFNHLMLADTGGASDIAAAAFNPASSDLEQSSMAGQPVRGADWSKVVPIAKRRLLDLNALGWSVEKAEGLTLVDSKTLAITNDNDFGMTTEVRSAQDAPLPDADAAGYTADAAGTLQDGDTIRSTRGKPVERALQLWLITFPADLTDYCVRSCAPP